MAGNSFGSHFRITTFGESHGRAIGAVLDGVRPGLPIDIGIIQKELDRRRPGQSKVTTSRAEADRIEILRRCTACDGARFFSHRRDAGRTGRQVAFIAPPQPTPGATLA